MNEQSGASILSEIDDLFAERDYAPSTMWGYRYVLGRLAGWLDAKDLTAEELTPREFMAFLDGHEGWGASMRYTTFCAMRAFYKWRFGPDHPALKARVRRREAGPQRVLSEEEVVKLLAYLSRKVQATPRLRRIVTYVQDSGPDPKAARDLALVSLALDTGLRSTEICRLAREHVDMERRTCSVRVKGSRWRTAVFSEPTRRRLEEWLKVRPEGKAETVFVSLGGRRDGHTAAGGPLTRDGLRAIFGYMAEEIGVKRFSPHAFRRTMATLAAKKGASSRLIQLMGGWSDLNLVELYTRSLTAEDAAPYLPTSTIGEEGASQ
jgi:integrase